MQEISNNETTITTDEKNSFNMDELKGLIQSLQELKVIEKNVNGEYSALKQLLAAKKYKKLLKKTSLRFGR